MMDVKTYLFDAPCSLLDVEAMQSWLEDMSMEGYLLKDCKGRRRNRFTFYKIEPLPTRYRLTPVSDRLEEWNLRPGEEYISITQAYGWEHVCTDGYFHIFRAYNDDAREIHTDPVIQAQAIRQLSQRIFKKALFWLSLPLVYVLILLAFGGVGHFWQTVILDRTGVQIFWSYAILIAVVKASIELVQLCTLYHRVKRGSVSTGRKVWKKTSVHQALRRVVPVFLLLLGSSVVMARANHMEQTAYQKLPAAGSEVPFLSVADMAQESDIHAVERVERVNTMRHWSHVLSPVNYIWVEIVQMADGTGNEGLVSMDVWYHEARYQWLSRQLTREYLENAKKTGTEMIEKPKTSGDLAYFYYDQNGDPGAVLQYGKTVVCVVFPRFDITASAMSFEYWIEALDQALSNS